MIKAGYYFGSHMTGSISNQFTNEISMLLYYNKLTTNMEVVCLILGLTPKPCSHAFWVLTSLHLPSFLLKMFLLFYM